MNTFHMILLLLAAVCFGISAFASPDLRRTNLLSLGLLLWVIVPLSSAIRAL